MVGCGQGNRVGIGGPRGPGTALPLGRREGREWAVPSDK